MKKNIIKRIIPFYIGTGILFSILTFKPYFFTGGDNFSYLNLAESIVEGNGYKRIYSPYEEPETKFPPFYPLIIAISFKIFGKQNILLLKLLQTTFYLLFLFIVYKIFELLYREDKYLKYFLFLLPFNFLFLKYSHYILSEIPYLLFSSLVVFFILLYNKKQETKFLISAIIFSVISFYTRTIGIAIIIASSIFFFIKKEKKAFMIYLISSTVFIIPWFLRSIFIETPTRTYFEQIIMKNPYIPELGNITIKDFVKRFFENFYSYFSYIMGKSIFNFEYKTISLVVGIIISVIIFFEFWKSFKKNKTDILHFYFMFYILIILSWPEIWKGERFLIGIIPFVYLFLFQFIKKNKYLFFSFIGLAVISNSIKIAKDSYQSLKNTKAYLENPYKAYPSHFRNYIKMANWCRENIKRQSIVITRKPAIFYYFSKIKSIRYPYTRETHKMIDFFKKFKKPYITFTTFYSSDIYYIYPTIKRYSGKFKIIKQLKKPDIYLLRFSE